MRKYVALVMAAVAGLVVARRAQVRAEERALWAEVTDAPVNAGQQVYLAPKESRLYGQSSERLEYVI